MRKVYTLRTKIVDVPGVREAAFGPGYGGKCRPTPSAPSCASATLYDVLVFLNISDLTNRTRITIKTKHYFCRPPQVPNRIMETVSVLFILNSLRPLLHTIN